MIRENIQIETNRKATHAFLKLTYHILSHHQMGLSVIATIMPRPCIGRSSKFPLNTRAVNVR